MYNYFFNYLKDNNPKNVISKRGVTIRKSINPVLRMVAPLTSKYKIKIVREAKLPKDVPIIFAATHGFLDDILFTLIAIKTHAYILFGNMPYFYNSLGGIEVWLNGAIIVDRTDKESRDAAKDKMEYAIELGSNLLVFPEGTWNKSENLLVLPLFAGVYDVAKRTGAWVVPVATHLDGKYVYVSVGKAFDISVYEKKEGMAILRDNMATLKWELMEQCDVVERKKLLKNKPPEVYWKQYINYLLAEIRGCYDREVEDNVCFKDKNMVDYETAFGFMKTLPVKKETAFLFRR